MKTRSTLVQAIPALSIALGLANVSCSPAESPPGRAGFWIELQDDETVPESCGRDGSRRSIPQNNAPVAKISQFSTAAEIEALELVKDGSDGATVKCTMKEIAVGSYEIDIELRDGAYYFELLSGGAGGGSAGYKSPETAGETIRSSACQVGTFLVPEGGGEGLITYACTNTKNDTTPDKVCRIEGTLYVRDCKK
jgi:hypothetical protein